MRAWIAGAEAVAVDGVEEEDISSVVEEGRGGDCAALSAGTVY